MISNNSSQQNMAYAIVKVLDISRVNTRSNSVIAKLMQSSDFAERGKMDCIMRNSNICAKWLISLYLTYEAGFRRWLVPF